MKGIATLIKALLRQTPAGHQGWREKGVIDTDSPLTLPLSLKGEGNKESSEAVILCEGYFLSFLGAGAASCLHMPPVSPQAGAFFGFCSGSPRACRIFHR